MEVTVPERRVTHQLFFYWEKFKGEHDVPLENDLDTSKLEPIWESCFMVQVRDIAQGGQYNYSYLGSDILKAHGLEEDDYDTLPIASATANRLESRYKKVINSKKPIVDEGEFTNLDNMKVYFRQVLTPYSEDGTNVTSILGAMRYRIEEPEG